ncbi:hypothetical protein [Evansella halocellulosilytica]|nr:hypothetical protein [Evansella halocellulosilytica]
MALELLNKKNSIEQIVNKLQKLGVKAETCKRTSQLKRGEKSE